MITTILFNQKLYYDVTTKGRQYRAISKQVIGQISDAQPDLTRKELAQMLKIGLSTIGLILSHYRKGRYKNIKDVNVVAQTDKTASQTTYSRLIEESKIRLDKAKLAYKAETERAEILQVLIKANIAVDVIERTI